MDVESGRSVDEPSGVSDDLIDSDKPRIDEPATDPENKQCLHDPLSDAQPTLLDEPYEPIPSAPVEETPSRPKVEADTGHSLLDESSNQTVLEQDPVGNGNQEQSEQFDGEHEIAAGEPSLDLTAQDTLVQPGIEDQGAAEYPSTVSATPDQPGHPWIEDQNAQEQDLTPDEFDSDSALGSDTSSTTTSLAQSIFEYRREHGRTYHAYKDGKYIFPNDERESERLDLQHQLLRITYRNQLYFAPLQNPKRCLDIGTGTGIWAIDFADEHPDCEVLGTDLSPTQPILVPPNLKFMIDDAEDLWIYEHKFDFIHLRLMSGSFGDWPGLLHQAHEYLEPGGWIEIQDYGLPVKSFDDTHVNTDVFRWGQLLCEASLQLGRPLGSDAVENLPRWLEAAGFVDIRQQMFMWPTNAWPKDPFMKMLGRWNQINIIEGLEGFCLALLTRGLGWMKEEVDVFVAKVTKDLKDRSIHAYFPMPVIYARKPYPGEVAFA